MTPINSADIRKLLDQHRISYRWQTHPPLYTAHDREALQLPVYGTIVKNLFLRNGCNKEFYLVVLPNRQRIDLRKLRDHIQSSRLSFATTEQLQTLLQVVQGSLSPFAALNDTKRLVQILFTDTITEQTIIGVHPNSNDETLWLSCRDILYIIKKHGSTYRFIDTQAVSPKDPAN